MIVYQKIQQTGKKLGYKDIFMQYTKCVYQDRGTKPRCIKFYTDANQNCIKMVAEYFSQFYTVYKVYLDNKIIGLKLEV